MTYDTKTSWAASTWFAVTLIATNVVIIAFAMGRGRPIGQLLSGLVIGYYIGLLVWRDA